ADMVGDGTRPQVEAVGTEIGDEGIKSCSDFCIRTAAEIARRKWWHVGPRHKSGHIAFSIIHQLPHDLPAQRILNTAALVPRLVRHEAPSPNEGPSYFFRWSHAECLIVGYDSRQRQLQHMYNDSRCHSATLTLFA